MSNKFIEKCPFVREGTASRSIYMALAKSSKPLSMAEISKRAKVSFEKTQTLVRAYMNPFHNAPMRRSAVSIVLDKDGFKLASCKAEPNAKRPPRGEKAKKKISHKASKKKAGPKSSKAAPVTVAPATAPITPPASEIK